MSYCRFSSANFRSDVYVYSDCMGGYTTHVAGNKLIVPPIPEPPMSMKIVRGAEFDKSTKKLVYKRKIDKVIAHITCGLWNILAKPHRWSMDIIPRKNIGLAHDSESFNDDTALECAERLEKLREIGYKVPQFAIDALYEEALYQEGEP